MMAFRLRQLLAAGLFIILVHECSCCVLCLTQWRRAGLVKQLPLRPLHVQLQIVPQLPSVPSDAQLPRLHTRLYSRRPKENDEEGDFQLWLPGVLNDKDAEAEPEPGSVKEEDAESNPELKDLMISAINWYKQQLSPLMPKNCRFLPTCSSYALDAIEEFGAIRGGILTAWRILRCNPVGGAGYDAPEWPPPSYFAGSNTWPKRRK